MLDAHCLVLNFMSLEKPPSAGSRFAPYRQALQAVAARTGAPLPSLVFSFAILHEATAIVPLFVIFLGARELGVGERVVSTVASTASEGEDNLLKQKSRQWVQEGELWAERVGRRYGVFGFEKGKGEVVSESYSLQESNALPARSTLPPKLAGDVANAIVAYGLTKVCILGPWLLSYILILDPSQALLPVRIGLSLYLTPWFSRRIVEPVRGGVMRMFRR